MKLHWAVQYGKGIFSATNGGAYSYRVHDMRMRRALEEIGVEITFDPQEDSDISVHLLRPDYFTPTPGKKNLLFTQTELTAPVVWSPRVNEADVVVTSCKHSKHVISQVYPGPVEVCPEGTDPLLFGFHQRQEPKPNEIFRFLFHGQDFYSTRKGLSFVLSAWMSWWKSGEMPANAQLYIKTSEFGGAPVQFCTPLGAQDMSPYLPLPRMDLIEKLGRAIIIDCRDLPVEEIAATYRTSHAFVSASCGEGWFLPLVDFMASGGPAIWTHRQTTATSAWATRLLAFT